MTYSEIKITFLTNLSISHEINIYNSFSGAVSTVWNENWVYKRTSTNQVSVGVGFGNLSPGEFEAIGFVNAFILDYNFPVQYEITRIANVVTIKSMIPNQTFTSGELLYLGEESGFAIFEINNFEGVAYDLVDISFSEADNDKCNKVKISIETSVLTTKVLSPFILNVNIDNPLSFDWLRSQLISVLLENADSQQLTIPITLPASLNVNNFNFNTGYSPNGGTLAIEPLNTFGLNVEYSLDNLSWQSSPNFSGLPAGDYTLHVRDQLGCSFEVEFFISEFGIQKSEFYYSKSNSIRMAERVDFNVISKNDENTLSCESLANLNYQELQRFNNSDEITLQFKSNYGNNIANIVVQEQTLISIPIIKMTNNIGLSQKRDAVIYKFNQFKSGIYFLSGNVYDYNSNVVVDSYSLNGLLPNWAIIGKYISINGIFYLIENVIYVEDKNADVLIISKVTLGFDQSVIVGAIFNNQDYEVYEVTIPMSTINNSYFRLKLELTDPNFESKTLISEMINTAEVQKDTLEIIYYNIDNNDVFYQTGIKHLLRMPFTKIGGYFAGDSESNKTDASVVLLNATLYEGNEFIFEPVTKEIYKKLVIALNHKFVFINKVGYVVDGEIEVDGPLEDSNLYVVTAKMLKNGKAYSNSNFGEIELITDELVEIPGMIEWDGGFIQQ